jgi:hypothetical protein
MVNSELNADFTPQYISKFMQKILGLFIRPIREVQEMSYQFENPYVMSSKKFMDKFPDFIVTPYEIGIREMVQSFKISIK